jgi:hypothetical protein
MFSVRLVVVKFEWESVTGDGTSIGTAMTVADSDQPASLVVRTFHECDSPLVRPVILVPDTSATPGVHSMKTLVVLGRYQTLSTEPGPPFDLQDNVNAPGDADQVSNVAARLVVEVVSAAEGSEHPLALQALTEKT